MDDLNKISNKNSSSVSRIQINDSKAGMENIDKDKINAIIMKHSKNSRYYKKQQSKEIELKSKANEKLKNYLKLSKIEIENAMNYADDYTRNLICKRDTSRIIVHIDMDAFYANVEIKDNPELKDKPMAVGSESMLSTSNYVARKYGVRAAMPGFIAKELCPQLIIVPCNFDKYRRESAKIMSLIAEYDSNYAAMSLDEAYLDLTDHMKQRCGFIESKRTFQKDINSNETITFGVNVEQCVNEIRHRIYLNTQLTASAGIACNLRLAKLCSDVNKPNGQFYLSNDFEVTLDFIRKLPIRKIKGIGPSSCIVLDTYGIKTCEDIYKNRALIKLLESQNTFEFLMNVCMGVGGNTIEHDDLKKSIGHETTFSSTNNIECLIDICKELSENVADELREDNLEAQKVNLKVKTINFEVFTRTKTLKNYTNDADLIFNGAKQLLINEFNSIQGLKLRLLGVRVSALRDINENKVKLNTIEKFFVNKKKKLDENDILIIDDDFDEDEMSLNEFKTDVFIKCPFCNEVYEGNQDFINQHVDYCSIK